MIETDVVAATRLGNTLSVTGDETDVVEDREGFLLEKQTTNLIGFFYSVVGQLSSPWLSGGELVLKGNQASKRTLAS